LRGLGGYLVPLLLLLAFRTGLHENVCDDAYIHMRVAAHLAAGQGMAFNAGQPIYVSTSPLWVLLLSGIRLATHDVLVASRILGALCEALLLLVLVRYGNALGGGRTSGAIAALLLCTHPVFLLTSFSGMEVSLYLLFIILSVDLLRSGHASGGLAVAAAAVWVRFDALLLCAACLAWVAHGLWRRGEMRRPANLRIILPAAALLAGYFVFGALVYGEIVPASVQRKMLTAAVPLSGSWWQGAWSTAREFLNVIVGRQSYWFQANSLLPITLPPLIIGSVWAVRTRARSVAPLVTFTALYVGVFVAGGSPYARNFPWYFVPILPAAYVLAGIGCCQLWDRVAQRWKRVRTLRWRGVAAALAGVAWAAAMMIMAIGRDSAKLTVANAERERAYAAIAVWAGSALDGKGLIAANEIGAVGFFAPPGVAILDMYGLLRKPDEISTPYVDLVRRERPEVIVTRENFNYRRGLEAGMEGAYEWRKFRSVDVGIRADLVPRLGARFGAVRRIYEDLDLGREYHAARVRPATGA